MDDVHRMNEEYRALGALKSVLSNGRLGIKAKKCLSEGVINSVVAERRKVNVLEMKYLRSLIGVSQMGKVWNEEVCKRAGIERKLASRADQLVLRWFWHVERMDKCRMTRRVLTAELSRMQVQGRPKLGWMDGVRVALGNRGMMVKAA